MSWILFYKITGSSAASGWIIGNPWSRQQQILFNNYFKYFEYIGFKKRSALKY